MEPCCCNSAIESEPGYGCLQLWQAYDNLFLTVMCADDESFYCYPDLYGHAMEEMVTMVDDYTQNDNPDTREEESPYDVYGWEFHKRPLLYAVILTVLFYAFVFFYINL